MKIASEFTYFRLIHSAAGQVIASRDEDGRKEHGYVGRDEEICNQKVNKRSVP
jgi:hypothetical protein